MKILGLHADLFFIGGHTRLFISMCDLFKGVGYNVKVVTRWAKKDCVDFPIEHVMPFNPEFVKTLPPERRTVTVKSEMHLFQYNLHTMKHYQPIRHLTSRDVSMMPIPIVNINGFYGGQFPEEVYKLCEESDYVFTDTELFVSLCSVLPVQDKQIMYVHFPPTNLKPIKGKEPAFIWANSKFTKKWIKKRWGVDAWKNTEVVNPFVYCDDYDPSPAWEERPYDCVMFARLGQDKFSGVADYLNDHFGLLAMGSQATSKQAPDYTPPGTLHKNLTLEQIRAFLSHSKVYVHGKGFYMKLSPKMKTATAKKKKGSPLTEDDKRTIECATSRTSQRLEEHFGLTILEAMSSACPVVVPRRGGPWSDVTDRGKYGLGYSSLKELHKHVSRLISDKAYWTEWSNKALEGAKRFDAPVTAERVKELLEAKK